MPEHTVALNRRARHDYAIDETIEAGIVLTGTEIKSIRAGRVTFVPVVLWIEQTTASPRGPTAKRRRNDGGSSTAARPAPG